MSVDLPKSRNVTLEELATLLSVDVAEVTSWASNGLPECKDKPGTYDFIIGDCWLLGHSVQNDIDNSESLKAIQMNDAQKIASGWLRSRSPNVEYRLDDIGFFLSNVERAGIDSREAIQSLHFAMEIFDFLGLYPGRVPNQSALGGHSVKTH